MNRARVTPWLLPALGGAVITLLLLLPPAAILEGYDLPRMHDCYKHDFRALVLAGEWPWWNPFTALGRPFFADVETALLYPPSWLVIPLGVSAGLVAIVWLHLALAIAGMRRLARQLAIAEPYAGICGLFFALSGALLGRIESGQLNLFCVVCLWPFLFDSFLQLQRQPGARQLVRVAAWVAGAFLAGSPAMLWCGLIGAMLFVVGSETAARTAARTLAWCGGAIALAAALAAVQLLPFVELVQQGNRPLHDTAFATIGSVRGFDWLSLLLPPGPWLDVNWETNLNVSAPLVALAVLATIAGLRKQPEIRALVLVAAAGLVLSLGEQTPVLPALAKVLPGFSGLRYPGRYGLMSVLAIALLASWWLARWAERNARTRFAARIVVALQLALSGGGIFSQGVLYRPPVAAHLDAAIRDDLKTEGLPRDHAPPRSALPVSLQRANAGAQSGTSTLTGFNNPGLARTWQTLYLLAGKPAPTFHRAEVPDEILFSAASHAAYFSLSVTARANDLRVRYHAPTGPRAFLSFQPETVARWPDAVEKIRAGHDFVRHALVEMPMPEMAGAGTGSARITAFARNRVVVDTDANHAALLVLAEAWYPGWRATIDGAHTDVQPANGWMRAVAVPAGHHTVDFSYVPRNLWSGFAVTLAGGLVALGLWRQPASRQRPPEAT
ncbi:MAG TPA: YfhO family protein [Candidatus Didemnitutus sp.]|nr:YfhO family protein [Candidatus Didemnitutus sp.]